MDFHLADGQAGPSSAAPIEIDVTFSDSRDEWDDELVGRLNLLRYGYADVYRQYMPQQNLAKISSAPGDPKYWEEYGDKLPNRAKTRAAADVAIEVEVRGDAGVTPEIRSVLEKVVSLARSGWQ